MEGTRAPAVYFLCFLLKFHKLLISHYATEVESFMPPTTGIKPTDINYYLAHLGKLFNKISTFRFD